MIRTLSPQLRRALAISILLLILFILWWGAVTPIAETMGGWREHIHDSLALLYDYRRTAAMEPALQASLEQLRSKSNADTGLLQGPNPAGIAAQLQGNVKSLVEGEAGQIISSQALPPANEAGFTKIAVRVDFRASIDALPKVIHVIESEAPSLFLDNISIRAAQIVSASSQTGASQDLTVRWDIYGYAAGSSP